jgi:Predicted membrane protein (DUF2142)
VHPGDIMRPLGHTELTTSTSVFHDCCLNSRYRTDYKVAAELQQNDHSKGERWPAIDGFCRALPVLYGVWATPLLFTLVLLVPPWQHPDEPAHFLRTAQIADGGLVGYRVGSTAGGRVDPAIIGAVVPFTPISFHSDVKVTRAIYESAHRYRWTGARQDADFRNTSIYPPFLYTPGVLAVWAGRAFDLSVIQTLYLARGANAAACALVTFFALALARRTRCALALLAILPMTMTLDSSASQDGLMISLVLLAAGMIDRVVDEARAASGSELLLITVALLLPAMSRPPYAVLAGLLLLVAPNRSLRGWLAAGAVVACTIGWWAYSATNLVLFPHADPSAQWAIAAASPAHLIKVAWTTIVTQSFALAEQMIGKLGWLDTSLPHAFVQFAAVVLAIAFLSATAGPARQPWCPMAIVILAAMIMGLALYFTFAEPGAPIIPFQGRYFLPLAAALMLALPRLPRLGLTVLPVASAGIALFALTAPAVVIRALVHRYYLIAG